MSANRPALGNALRRCQLTVSPAITLQHCTNAITDSGICACSKIYSMLGTQGHAVTVLRNRNTALNISKRSVSVKFYDNNCRLSSYGFIKMSECTLNPALWCVSLVFLFILQSRYWIITPSWAPGPSSHSLVHYDNYCDVRNWGTLKSHDT